MKFFYFYEDLIAEARTMADDKFSWIAENIGNWLFDELFSKPNLISSLPNMDQFKTYVRTSIKKLDVDPSEMVQNLHLMDTFLNRLDKKESANFIKEVVKLFPNISAKIQRYGKPEPTGGKRGRPIGSKNKPKSEPLNIDVIKTTVKPKSEPQQELPTKRGRPKIYDDNLTAIERMRYRKEGPEIIQKLEQKVSGYDKEIDQTIARIKKIMVDIDKRKKFFGIE